jgi:uncharacterized membrane protein
VIHIFQARPLLTLGTLIGLLTWSALPVILPTGGWVRLVLSWNAGSALYLCLALTMMFRSSPAQARIRALRQDDGNYVILSLVILSAIVCLIAMVMVLGIAKNLQGADRIQHIVLATLTVVTSWFFTQVMFANHYAHDYYVHERNGEDAGLLFPGRDDPDYIDFLYFSFVIGTSGQTADVSITTRAMRRLGLLHCVLAFFFNTTLIALTINIAAGFISFNTPNNQTGPS